MCLVPSLEVKAAPSSRPTSTSASIVPSSRPTSTSAPTAPSSRSVHSGTRPTPTSYGTTVRGHRPLHGVTSGRASSRVTRRDFEERLPRSAPDALRFEPGVYVQQTAHGQGSAYIRGRTGQQTLLLFDGIRLNNAIFRQGPNQYFFTVDARSVKTIDVRRGGASTLLGSDAVAGAINATPRDPRFNPLRGGFSMHPGVMLRWASADGEAGGRFEVDTQLGTHVAILAGTGYRRAGLLTSGGALSTLAVGNTPAGGGFLVSQTTGGRSLGRGIRSGLRIYAPSFVWARTCASSLPSTTTANMTHPGRTDVRHPRRPNRAA